jgi:HK97 family phage major capsid protein
MSIKALKEQKTKLLLDAQKIVTAKDVTTEQRATAQKMLDQIDEIEQSIAIEERIAKDAAETRSAGRPPRAQPGKGMVTDETRSAEKAAFIDYIKYGKRDTSILREQRDLSTGNAGVIIAQDYCIYLSHPIPFSRPLEPKGARMQMRKIVNLTVVLERLPFHR